jgi:hypothetical protein
VAAGRKVHRWSCRRKGQARDLARRSGILPGRLRTLIKEHGLQSIDSDVAAARRMLAQYAD